MLAGSKRLIGLTPLLPASAACQLLSMSWPRGVTAPMPVITTRSSMAPSLPGDLPGQVPAVYQQAVPAPAAWPDRRLTADRPPRRSAPGTSVSRARTRLFTLTAHHRDASL